MIYLYNVVDILSKHLGITLPDPPIDEGVTSPVNVIELPPPPAREAKPLINKIDYLTRSGTENLLAQGVPGTTPFQPTDNETRKGFFGLLDDLISSQSPEGGAVTGLTALTGSMDPRIDCVKGGIVDAQSAEVLVEL